MPLLSSRRCNNRTDRDLARRLPRRPATGRCCSAPSRGAGLRLRDRAARRAGLRHRDPGAAAADRELPRRRHARRGVLGRRVRHRLRGRTVRVLAGAGHAVGSLRPAPDLHDVQPRSRPRLRADGPGQHAAAAVPRPRDLGGDRGEHHHGAGLHRRRHPAGQARRRLRHARRGLRHRFRARAGARRHAGRVRPAPAVLGGRGAGARELLLRLAGAAGVAAAGKAQHALRLAPRQSGRRAAPAARVRTRARARRHHLPVPARPPCAAGHLRALHRLSLRLGAAGRRACARPGRGLRRDRAGRPGAQGDPEDRRAPRRAHRPVLRRGRHDVDGARAERAVVPRQHPAARRLGLRQARGAGADHPARAGRPPGSAAGLGAEPREPRRRVRAVDLRRGVRELHRCRCDHLPAGCGLRPGLAGAARRRRARLACGASRGARGRTAHR